MLRGISNGLPLRLRHRLTAYHLTYGRRSESLLGICSCGWTAHFLRTPWRYKALRLVCAIVGHDAEEPQPVHCGPIDFEESDDTLIGHIAICGRCLKDVA